MAKLRLLVATSRPPETGPSLRAYKPRGKQKQEIYRPGREGNGRHGCKAKGLYDGQIHHGLALDGNYSAENALLHRCELQCHAMQQTRQLPPFSRYPWMDSLADVWLYAREVEAAVIGYRLASLPACKPRVSRQGHPRGYLHARRPSSSGLDMAAIVRRPSVGAGRGRCIQRRARLDGRRQRTV